MARSLPPLNALRAFDMAARTQNFTAAAQALHVTQGAVSRHVSQLEAFLGIQLFDRDHRAARLTAAGAAYARAIGGAFDRMEQATRTVREVRLSRPLRIRLFPTVAIKWLITRLAEFHALHPAIEVRITTVSSLVRFDPAQDDFTIQIGNLPQLGVHFDPLLAIDLVPVCAPDYLRRLPVTAPADLFGHNLMSSVQRPEDWALWFGRAGVGSQVITERLRFGMKFGNSAMAYQAAIDGLGVALAQLPLVRDDIALGRLVMAHPLAVRVGEAYYLASAVSAQDHPDIAAFRAWILSRSSVGQDEGPPGVQDLRAGRASLTDPRA
jgi:LysR family transcriptional regulator, glycine cleavage system transcriptional activator